MSEARHSGRGGISGQPIGRVFPAVRGPGVDRPLPIGVFVFPACAGMTWRGSAAPFLVCGPTRCGRRLARL